MDLETTLHLEAHRRRAGVPLEVIAETTKISSRFLRAIECEEFDKLPGGVFNINYIRQYAAAIDFPAQRLLETYETRMKALQPELEPEAPRPQSRLRSLFNWLLRPAELR